MFLFIAQFLDRLAIKAACSTVRCGFALPGQGAAAQLLLEDPLFLLPEMSFRQKLQFAPDGINFQAESPLQLSFPETNTIHGKFFRTPGDWRSKPLVTLIHGWNGEDQYTKLFGWYAKKLRKLGLNVVAIELPFHYHRKPRDILKVRNFISDDLVTMLNLTRQSLGDIGATINYFKKEGCPSVGLWGFSLGAWLTGLFISSNTIADAAALSIPVPSLNEAIQNLAFCGPIRSALERESLDLSRLNLATHKPMISHNKILIEAGKFDLFSSPQSLEDLQHAWNRPETWLLNHGHISMLAAPSVISRTAHWFSEALHASR
ncbi:MAG: hypothetical protein ACO1QB_06960 [Verrucomicrobiales bacterium]